MTEPSPIPGDGSFELAVVGESHYQQNLQTICGPRQERGEDRTLDAVLVLDDANPHDRQAVRVDIQDLTVGYLSRDNARVFRAELKRAGYGRQTRFAVQANIRGGWQSGDDVGNYGVWLDLPAPLPKAKAIKSQPRKKETTEVAPPKVATGRKSRTGRIILFLVLGLIAAFIACVLFGLLLQAVGAA